MDELPLTGNILHKVEYNGKFVHALGRIQLIDLMIKNDIFYATCRLAIQTVATTLSGFQSIKRCVQYLDSHPHKPIFYTSNYYDGSNFIRLPWSGNKLKTTQLRTV